MSSVQTLKGVIDSEEFIAGRRRPASGDLYAFYSPAPSTVPGTQKDLSECFLMMQ